MRLIWAVLLCLLCTPAVHAVAVDKPLDDPVKEAIARDLMRELRCFVCQNQSIEDSNADMARDLRLIVRERVEAGQSPEEIKAFLVERYGDWVLLKPPFKQRTIILWAGPFVLLAVLLGLLVYRARRTPSSASAAKLSEEEEARLAALLEPTKGQDR